jgi:hypothetical protein
MYRRAMLRAYAESVGLDTESALSQFERTFEEPPPHQAALPALPVATSTPPPSARSTMLGRRPLALTGLAGAAMVVLAVWVFSGDARPEIPVQNAVTAAREAARPASVQNSPPPDVVQAASAAPAPAATSGTRPAPAAATPAEPVAATPVEDVAPEPPLATEGRLVVVSEPPGARVTVNGVGWGSTPLTIRYLPLGEKRVRVTKTGYISAERTVRVDGRRPNATVRLALRERP